MTTCIVPTSSATEINRLHHAAQRSAGEALQLAKQAGDLLLNVKSALGHGEWLPWLEANCDVGERQAQRYMRLSKHWAELEANMTSTSDLGAIGISGALAQFETPRNLRAVLADSRANKEAERAADVLVKVAELVDRINRVADLWSSATNEQLDIVRRTIPDHLLRSTHHLLGLLMEATDGDVMLMSTEFREQLLEPSTVVSLRQMHASFTRLLEERPHGPC